MSTQKAIPPGLQSLVDANVAPGSEIINGFYDFDRISFCFVIKWRSLKFSLILAQEYWEDKRYELIQLLSRLAVPYPETTHLGHRFWVAFNETQWTVRGDDQYDATDFVFSIHKNLSESEIIARIAMTGAAQKALDFHSAFRPRVDARAFEIGSALLQVKNGLDNGIDFAVDAKLPLAESLLKIDSEIVESLLHPNQAQDLEVHDYAAAKLYLAFKVSDKNIELKFDWTDFMYLGITEQDFKRVVSLWDGADWVANGTALKPTIALLKRMSDDKDRGHSSAVGAKEMVRSPKSHSIELEKTEPPPATGRCFVMMPFGKRVWIRDKEENTEVDFDEVYRRVLLPIFQDPKLKLEVVRADELDGPGIVIDQIFDEIEQAEILVADVTTRNPNVLYEVGYSYGRRRTDVILLSQDPGESPFDIHHMRIINYRWPAEAQELERVGRRVRNAIGEVRAQAERAIRRAR